MTIKTPKETFTPTPAIDAPAEAKPLQTQVQDSFAAKPQETNNIVIGNETGKPSNIVKITNSEGKAVDAVQTMGTDGKPVLIYENETYKLDQSKSKAGSQSWVSDDGSTVTQNRGRNYDNTSGSTTDTSSKTGSTNDSTSAKPTTGDSVGGDTGSAKPEGGSAGGDTGSAKPGGGSAGGDTATATPGGDLKGQPVNTDVDKKKDSDIKFQPIDMDKDKSRGGEVGGGESGGRKGGGESGGESGERKGGGESGGESGGRKGGGEGGAEGGERKGGGESGGAEKGAERGDGKLSIPEKSAEKPSERSTDKPTDKPTEKPESGSEKPLEKIDLSKPEARRELFEALKSMRDVLDGKTDLKNIDPNQRALIEQLMKLDQQTTNKLFNLLSLEFQGKGTGMSESAYLFNLRTLMGLEKLTSPTQPPPLIPGLSPELAKSLFNLFRMYSGDGQTAQRSTMLAEAYKFSVDYNEKLGLNDKNGLTSRDVLVALNSMSKDFGDLATKQAGSLANLLAGKETHAQLVGRDVKEQIALTAEQAKQREVTGSAADQHALAQARAQEAALKVPHTLQASQDSAVGKVEGQILKDARLDAHAAEQAATTKTPANQFGQKDPLTAEQKELGERDQGIKRRLEEERDKDKDKERDEIARRMAMEAAIAAAGGARATSAEITEGKEEGDKDEKKQDEKEARRQYRTKQGDTLEMIAETQLKRKTAATLIYNINKDRIPAKVMGNLHIISMKSDMVLELPTPNEVKTFKGPYLQFQYREFASAEEELAFWQKFITGQEPGHSSLFDKFGLGQGGASGVGAGVDDSFAAEAFTAAQRQSIHKQLGLDSKEATSQTTKTVRYGESIRKFAARTLFDEALWELVARKNNLPVVEDNKGEKTAKLKSYQKLILPTAAEIKEYKQASGSATQQTFEMVSRECPKCRRLVRQNESVCPPPCFYAFVETSSADAQPVEPVAEVKDEPSGRMLRRRRTTGFVSQSESKPDVVPDKPFENEVIDTVLKAAGLSSAAKVEAPQITSKMPIPASSGMASNPSKRGIKAHEFDSVCRVVLTPKDREGNKFERRLEVRKDDAWVPCVVYEIGQQESFVTEFDPSGAPRKQRIDLPFESAMELSENHINEAWKEYKQQFLES